LTATAAYVRRKSLRRKSADARSGRAVACESCSPGGAVAGSVTRVFYPVGSGLDCSAMARTTAVRLTGEDLTPDDVWHVAVEDGTAELDDSAREKLAAARAVVEDALRKDEPTYGVTTGFGRFVSMRIPGELAEELQLRLLRSHACGVGEPYPDEIVRAA